MIVSADAGGYMAVEKKAKGKKKASRREAHDAFSLVGDNRIELVPQRTSFEGAKRRANDRESRMQEVI